MMSLHEAILSTVPGAATGLLIWWIFFWPKNAIRHERARRSHGLPPKRVLPEDNLEKQK